MSGSVSIDLLKNEINTIYSHRKQYSETIDKLQYRILNVIDVELYQLQDKERMLSKKFHFNFIKNLLNKLSPSLSITKKHNDLLKKIKYLIKAKQHILLKNHFIEIPLNGENELLDPLAMLIHEHNLLVKAFEKNLDSYSLSTLHKKESLLAKLEEKDLFHRD